MKILSLFDGMACGMLAMLGEGVEVEKYDAYEIDKYAIQTSSHNFPIIEHHGDVFKADFTAYKGYDFLVGGSPCTYWSIAQSTDKRETTASGIGWELFSQYVRALHEAQPNFFIYENNKSMSKDIKASITETFGFDPICINSALVSAQNRQRLYWVGKRDGDRYVAVRVDQPEDRGILLKDILESGVVDASKSVVIKPHVGTARDYVVKSQNQVAFEPVCVAQRGCNPEGLVAEPCEPIRAINYPLKDVKESDSGCIAHLDMPGQLDKNTRVYGENGKSPTLSTCQGGHREPKVFSKVQIFDFADKPAYEVKDGQITIKGKQYPIKLKDGFYIIRKLTVRECMRLQTVPEWYDFPVSSTQAYKMLGNGWTVEVIKHLVHSCLTNETIETASTGKWEQLSLFDM